jgi:ABC-2 type transport system ATP-binding protein
MLLSFQSVSKSYGDIQALRGVQFEVERGTVLAVLGPNGAGKSTLFGCLLGTVLPDSGAIHVAGKEVTESTRRKIGYLAERIALYPQRTCHENAVYLASLKGIASTRVEQAFERVGMGEFLNRKVSQLSKGQLQRVGLAIALAGEPELMVLDEPFNGLDPVVLESLLEVIREEQQRGATLLISTHTISAAEEIATHVAILLDGKLALNASREELRLQFPGCTLEAIYHRVAKSRRTENKEAIAA